MSPAPAKTRPRKARTVGKDIVPKGPCVGFHAIENLVWRAQAASMPSPGYVDLDGFDDARAAVNSAVDDAIAEHQKRAEEYDQRESVIRGQRPVKQASPAAKQPVPPAADSSAFYQLNSDTGELEAAPMDEKPRKAMTRFLRLHKEQDGPQDDPGPAAPAALPPTGPGSPDGDPALD